MKKIKALGAAAAVAVASISLVACGGGGSSTAGTYHLTEMTQSGVTMTLAEINEMYSQLGMEEEIDVVLEMKADGTFTISDPSGMIGMEDVQGTWTEDGANITLTSDGEDIGATLADGVLTLADEESGISMSFAQ
jgi:hypothetical protein